uniref:Uncharacterized protein n=1 Tax=Polytomella parva TaxID=51329 RepID=A0A7S0V512_9CHLO|mmetsp:Transcript_27951/g.51632  ORF Transcript_27951/g.51632 Transcript_27951/m.51632 type:complete len:265 (-) Transcript_27951:53-847(-)|eukprot:CAMPEP_0175040846 /NCGR_PEP_ID=MMETSP0052_2-20121109/1525_1 /TAXON_ID=51329 ORGANISM="Polytomella parva, Strain SAG 63-3" /NCGR_SAMPLE_ID=MMETSP0052_2 /ASSEMBLY_ACC=CAM_ASM_000194 /LENGTH=264 /DNA_ID=CAMNT_0016303173 /DNA_START=46 /DNA_END=840 /DNA_ORIENTATION=+
MASELSRLIEDELKNRGYGVGDDKDKKSKSKKSLGKEQPPNDEESQLLVGGSMSIENKVTTPTTAKLFTAKKVFIISGSIFLILAAALIFTIKIHGSGAVLNSLSPPGASNLKSSATNSTKTPGSSTVNPDGKTEVEEDEESIDKDHPLRGTVEYEDGENSTVGEAIPPNASVVNTPNASPPPKVVSATLSPSPPVDPASIVDDDNTGTASDYTGEDDENQIDNDTNTDEDSNNNVSANDSKSANNASPSLASSPVVSPNTGGR